MSAFPDEPLHFFGWLRDAAVDGSWRAESPAEFVPRMAYGPYLEATMRAAQASASGGMVLDVRHADVVGLAPDRSTFELRGGATLSADRSVLALGNFPPQPLAARAEAVLGVRTYVTTPGPGRLSTGWIQLARSCWLARG